MNQHLRNGPHDGGPVLQNLRQVVRFARKECIQSDLPEAVLPERRKLLAGAEIRDKAMWIGGHRFEAMVMPAAVELPTPAAALVEQLKAAGGKVLPDGTSGQAMSLDSLDSVYTSGRLAVPYDQIIVGRFSRQGRDILVLVNVAAEPYSGRISGKNSASWLVAHPDSGQIERITADESGWMTVSLPPRGVILLISDPQTNR